ncbi:putative reverse transcriptase domain-containing protein [Tanacetum coccineum]|uniref:Reverse transcriptase domain-containing protein n=1 Tax=Tanacetum coccineum TaxID=301880 RepID=A0ABQ5IN76_9ASTR
MHQQISLVRKPLEFSVGEYVLLKVSPWKGVIRFGKKGKLAPRFVGPFEILERISPVAYMLDLLKELNDVHDTLHVSNLKKCLADPTLQVPLDEIRVDAKNEYCIDFKLCAHSKGNTPIRRIGLAQYGVKMDDPNITMEEYIRLEEEIARRGGRRITGRVLCTNEDYMVIYDKNSFSYKIISVDNLKTDSENDNDKVNMPSFSSPKPTVSYFNDLDYFKDFEKEFPAIVYNDALTSKLDFLTEPTGLAIRKSMIWYTLKKRCEASSICSRTQIGESSQATYQGRNGGEPSKDRNGRYDNKRTRIGNDFATTTNPIRKENTGSEAKGNHQNQVVAVNGGQGRGNNGNQACGRAFMLGAEEARQDLNIVRASGQLVEIDKVIKGCKLEIEGHEFDINLIPFGIESFNVIMLMDWLSNHKAEIICYEKVVRIPLLDCKVLRVLEERPKEKARHLMSAKEQKQEEMVVERAFQTLKDKLCNSPVLALPDRLEDFVVYYDASGLRLGCVLMQKGKLSIKDMILAAQEEASDESAGLQKGLDKMIEHRSDGAFYYLNRIWVPLKGDVRTLIMDEAYKSKYFVHPGADKMYYDLRDRYWWSGMKKDIVVYVSRCLTCLKVKAEHQRPSGLLQQPEIPEWK